MISESVNKAYNWNIGLAGRDAKGIQPGSLTVGGLGSVLRESGERNELALGAVASLGGGWTPEGKIFLWANFQRIVEKRGRTGKKKV